MNYSDSSIREISRMSREDYILNALNAMKARFSQFIVTPEQIDAWNIGFAWIHEYARVLSVSNDLWRILPEFVAPLLSGRPDLIVDTGTHLLIVEMKTGHKTSKSTGAKQVLEYADEFWGKQKIGQFRTIVPIILSNKQFSDGICDLKKIDRDQRPGTILRVNPEQFIELSKEIYFTERQSRDFKGEKTIDLFKYSPRPTVVEAAMALVSALDDKNVVTGLADTDEIKRIIEVIRKRAKSVAENGTHEVIAISGAPGAGKTLVGLRIAHDKTIQELLHQEIGTPLYLTGNAPLVDVLVESLARDEVKRLGTNKLQALSSASTKVRLIHGITEKKLGIESNVIIFDEGQRIWNEERMQSKRRDKSLGSEAEEVLKYLQKLPWSLAVVLIGEGQEINTGEEGIRTWIKAIEKLNDKERQSWQICMASNLLGDINSENFIERDDNLVLRANQRTDNAAEVSLWVKHFLDGNFDEAKLTRNRFKEFPIYFTRSLDTAKDWLQHRAEADNLRSGLVASSTSKRLVVYGIDAFSGAERSFNWANWYLNDLPDLSSSKALEVAASEYKCQGLELDLVGVCWSWDLIIENSKWQPRTLRADKSQWKRTQLSKAKFNFQINAYRVLLTRSRKGMVIWIPKGDQRDTSRNPIEIDTVAHAFQKSGVIEI